MELFSEFWGVDHRYGFGESFDANRYPLGMFTNRFSYFQDNMYTTQQPAGRGQITVCPTDDLYPVGSVFVGVACFYFDTCVLNCHVLLLRMGLE